MGNKGKYKSVSEPSNQLIKVQSMLVGTLVMQNGTMSGLCKVCQFQDQFTSTVRAHVLDAHLRGKNMAMIRGEPGIFTQLAPDALLARWSFGGRNVFYSCRYCYFTHCDDGVLRHHMQYQHFGGVDRLANHVMQTQPVVDKTPKEMADQYADVLELLMEKSLAETLYVCKVCRFQHSDSVVKQHVKDTHLKARNAKLEPAGRWYSESKHSWSGSNESLFQWVIGKNVFYNCNVCNFTHRLEALVRKHEHFKHQQQTDLIKSVKEEQILKIKEEAVETETEAESVEREEVLTTQSESTMVMTLETRKDSSGAITFRLIEQKKNNKPLPPRERLQSHIFFSQFFTETDDDNFSCKLCRRLFECESTITNHLRDHHNVKEETSVPDHCDVEVCEDMACVKHRERRSSGCAVSVATSRSSLNPGIIAINGVTRLGNYVGKRKQYWKEPFIKQIMQAVKDKEIDMRKAAKLIGVPYGTFYSKYRTFFGGIRPSTSEKNYASAWSEEPLSDTECKIFKQKDLGSDNNLVKEHANKLSKIVLKKSKKRSEDDSISSETNSCSPKNKKVTISSTVQESDPLQIVQSTDNYMIYLPEVKMEIEEPDLSDS